MNKAKILIVDKIDKKGIELLEKEPNFEVDIQMGIERGNLLNIIENYDGLIIRSDTNVDVELMDKAKKLKVVGRAGNGVDNIDIPEATKRGIIVANTPDSNSISACELTIGLLLAQSRNIAKADRFLKEGNWDRDSFMGTELFNKTLGIIGLGRIGGLIATRMNAFGMKVIAYDPYISDERFKRFNVEKKDILDELLKEADFITIHTPRTEETINIISEKEVELMKNGVRIVNAARGKLINEKALCKGLKSGKIASVGIDVHEKEPRYSAELYEYENVIVTPHIGATTSEAQQNVGVTIAKQVINGIKGNIVPNAVNLPTIHRDELKEIKPYIDLAEKLGKIYYQINKGAVKLVDITYWGDIGCQDTEMVTIAFVKGLLDPVMADKVNYINAMIKAEEAGIGINHTNICKHHNNYSNLITIKITNSAGNTFTLSGTISNRNEGKLVEIMGYEVDVKPTECMVFLQNYDVPGVIGHVGTFLGTEGVNVATMQVGRKLKGDKALMLLNVDDKVTQDTLLGLQKYDDILWAKFVQL
ncbi:MAG: phosphoglycerate dehydrogenase [Clostridium cochlearium]|uniref:phosphoglycerate dehydrogenase n=1 Tax=Clostridium cochlearium TaxID=1494 RepID=UPI00280BDEB2|nr:phosphoglycerate dehydrogenase [Clostridium cochlearium]MDU1442311.1 phosphoglycerate dehydrogenase [Clostridium cochlearium]